jgi:hypothetical protein
MVSGFLIVFNLERLIMAHSIKDFSLANLSGKKLPQSNHEVICVLV